MKSGFNRMERVGENDRFFDFCLWEYRPLRPHVNKLRSAALLYDSLAGAGMDRRVYDMIDAIRDRIGPSRTVWGLKLIEGRPAWEFYFYDYGRRQRKVSASAVIDALRPVVETDLTVDEAIPYFMFSIDIDEALCAGARPLDSLHLYIGNVGSSVSSGICYHLSRQGRRMENIYFFFDARNQMHDIADKLACSVFIDPAVLTLDQVLWPELRDCRVIVVANKQVSDSVYFSGLSVEQLLFFMKKLNYPLWLTEFVADRRRDLDHLWYDVGYDYRMTDRRLEIVKSGYYGIF